MSNILGAISSNDGIVIISDGQTNNLQNIVVEINQRCVAVISNAEIKVKDFLYKYIIPKKPLTVLNVINLIKSEIEKHSAECAQFDSSFFLAYYENDYFGYFMFRFKNENMTIVPINDFYYFAHLMDDLTTYIFTKIFSTQMNIDELKNLMGFVTLQCINVFNLDSFVKITTISKDGVKTMSKDQVQDILSTQDKKDNELKKIFSDFFVNEVSHK